MTSASAERLARSLKWASNAGFIAFLLVCVSATMVWILFTPVPGVNDLTFTEGTVLNAGWRGGRHRRFEVRLDAAPRLTFQPKQKLDERIAEIVKPGTRVRIGHTDDTISAFIDNLKVYSLEVDGTVLYSIEDYRRSIASDRPFQWVTCVGSALGAAIIIGLRVRQNRAFRKQVPTVR